MVTRARLRRQMPFISFSIILLLIIGGIYIFSGFVEASSSRSHQHASSPFFTQRASWIILPSSFAGKVIHYSLVENIYVKSDSGSDFTSTRLGDIWEKIDAEGQLQVFHAVYTSLDGKIFYQEIYEDSSTNTIVFGKSDTRSASTFSHRQSSMTSCIEQLPARSIATRSTALVPFADGTEMHREGFDVSQALSPVSQSVPNTFMTTAPDRKSIAQYAAGGLIHVWSKTETLNDVSAKRSHHVEVDQQKRVLFEQGLHTDMSGKVLSSTAFTYGPISVYNPQDISLSAFSNVQQILAGGCSR